MIVIFTINGKPLYHIIIKLQTLVSFSKALSLCLLLWKPRRAIFMFPCCIEKRGASARSFTAETMYNIPLTYYNMPA